MVLMLVILLQQGKGGDIANAFGGGSSQAAFGARTGATVLSRATTVCFVLFIVGALALSIVGQGGGGSVVGGRATPRPATTPAPATAPASPSTQPATPPASATPAAPPAGQAPAPAPATPPVEQK
jgi:preprotein translocase subunit SecG